MAEQKRIEQKWAEEEARQRIEEHRKTKEAYRIEQERIAEETRLHAKQKHQMEEARRIVDKEGLEGKFEGDQCKANFFVRVRKITSEQLGVEESEITLKSSFRNDLGADELDFAEVIMSLEEEFEIEVPDEDADSIRTVEEAVDYCQEKQIVKYFSLIHNLFYEK